MSHTVVVMYGSQTFNNTSAKIHTFVMHKDGTGNRSFPDTQMSPMLTNGRTKEPASTDGDDRHGAWYRKTYGAVDGVVMALTARTTRNGRPYSNGVVHIALREDGPMLSINVNLPAHRKATFETIHLFQGRGDVLTKEDLADYNIRLNPNYVRNNMDDEELEELFDISILSMGTPKPATVEMTAPGGGTVRVQVAPEAGRRLRIRKRRK